MFEKMSGQRMDQKQENVPVKSSNPKAAIVLSDSEFGKY